MSIKTPSIVLKPGYVTTSYPLETDIGKKSSARLVQPQDSMAEIDGDPVKIVDAVTNFVIQSTAEKSAKESKEESAHIIRAYSSAVRECNAKKGDYNKTYRINGKLIKKMQYAIKASTSDRFSVPSKREDIEALKTSLGDNVFKSLFQEETTISIRSDIMEDETKRKELSRKLLELFGVEGIKEFFERKTIIKTKKGLDQKQYTLSNEIREKLNKAGVKQASDSIKEDSSVIPL